MKRTRLSKKMMMKPMPIKAQISQKLRIISIIRRLGRMILTTGLAPAERRNKKLRRVVVISYRWVRPTR